MIASVPSIAFGSPPLTGASRNSTPFCRARRADLLRHQRADRAHVHDDRPRPRAFEHAARPEHRLLHLRPVGQHRDDDVRPRRDLRGGRSFAAPAPAISSTGAATTS